MTYFNIDSEFPESWEDEAPSSLDLIEQARANAKTEWERNFVASVTEQYNARWTISEKQAAVLVKIASAVKPAREPRVPAAALDLSGVPSGRYAVPDGDTRLKVKIDHVTEGKWAGWTFVKDAAEYGQGRKYGSQRPGQTYRGAIEEQLRAIAADPRAASAAYGKLTSTCGVCGRHLEDEESVARGIGPICAGRF